jgi:isopentenyldiphosphate isomerase
MEDEYLDVVDDNDKVLRKELRSKIYNGFFPSQNIRVINILVFNSKGQILLPKRSMNRKIYPGCYDFSCGEHVKSGEDYYAAAIRGAREELKLKNTKLIELGKLSPKEGVVAFMKIYKLILDNDLSDYDKEGIDKLEWFSLKDALKLAREHPEKFKHDLPIVLEWYDQKYKNI